MRDHAIAKNIPCKTLEGDIIQLPLEVINQSQTFDGMYRNLDLASVESSSFVFSVAIKTATFHKLVEWCKSRIGIAEPVVNEDPVTKGRIRFEMTEGEKKFFEMPVDDLVELITAANYLDVKSLFLFACQSLALKIKKSKSPEEIRSLMGIMQDMTEDEVQEIRKQTVWCNY